MNKVNNDSGFIIRIPRVFLQKFLWNIHPRKASFSLKALLNESLQGL